MLLYTETLRPLVAVAKAHGPPYRLGELALYNYHHSA